MSDSYEEFEGEHEAQRFGIEPALQDAEQDKQKKER
jgi:hypothetical protein